MGGQCDRFHNLLTGPDGRKDEVRPSGVERHDGTLIAVGSHRLGSHFSVQWRVFGRL
jgi:hypothetical protein